MAKWYVELGYGIYNGQLINQAEYLTLKKYGIVFEIVEG